MTGNVVAVIHLRYDMFSLEIIFAPHLHSVESVMRIKYGIMVMMREGEKRDNIFPMKFMCTIFMWKSKGLFKNGKSGTHSLSQFPTQHSQVNVIYCNLNVTK